MRIDVFAEPCPNPYEPCYDAQIAQFIEDGHEVRVFTFGKHDRTRNSLIDRFSLDRRTTYLPWTLRHLPAHLLSLASALLQQPMKAAYSLALAWDARQPYRRSVLDATRAFSLPGQAPDVCLIHNLVTAQPFCFLPSVLTAHWAETQACVVQEAMLMKLLVVASRTDAVPA